MPVLVCARARVCSCVRVCWIDRPLLNGEDTSRRNEGACLVVSHFRMLITVENQSIRCSTLLKRKCCSESGKVRVVSILSCVPSDRMNQDLWMIASEFTEFETA